MMKKALILLLMLPFALAETFYVCNGGTGTGPKTNSCSSAWDIDDINNAGNWDTDVANDGKIGPGDNVIFKDDGGWFRQRLVIPGSGKPGNPIIFRAEAGDEPILSPSERFRASDWELWYESGGTKIYRLKLEKEGVLGYSSYWPATSEDGENWDRPKMEKQFSYMSPDTIRSSLRDEWYYTNSNYVNNYVFYRKDDGNLPDYWEIGWRPYALSASGDSYLVFDGIDSIGPCGCNDEDTGRHPCYESGNVDSRGFATFQYSNSESVVVKNTEISYGGFMAMKPQHLKDFTMDNVNIHHYNFAVHFKGSQDNHVQGTQDCRDILVQNSRFWEIGTTPNEEGDREPLGFLGVQNILVRNNYFGPYMHDHEDEVNHRSNQIAVVGVRNITIENNYFYDSGTNFIGMGGGQTGLSVKDIYIRNNVFDTRMYNYMDHIDDGSAAVMVGCCRNYGNVITDCDQNYPELGSACYEDHSGEVYITNNLFINARDVQGWEYADDKWSSIIVLYDKYDKIVISNNIFYNNPSVHEIYLNPYYTTPKGQVFIENNIFYQTPVSDWNSCVFKYNSLCWDYNHINGDSIGSLNYDLRQKGLSNVRNNMNVDPMLVSTGQGTGYSKALKEGSPAIDAGKDLGSGFAVAFDPGNDFSGSFSMLDQDSYDAWEIGPFVYTGGNVCVSDWVCGAWSDCVDGKRTRTCTDMNGCSEDDIQTETCSMMMAKHSTPIIDGYLYEWNENLVSFSHTSSDNQVDVFVSWDSENLYIAYDVLDADTESVGGTEHFDDSVEVYLDTDNDKTSSLDSDDYHLVATVDNSLWSEPEFQFTSATRTISGGYSTEISIPWSQLNMDPGTVGFLLCNNDRDDGIRVQFDHMGLIDSGSYARPDMWGEISFSDECNSIGIDGVASAINAWLGDEIGMEPVLGYIESWRSGC